MAPSSSSRLEQVARLGLAGQAQKPTPQVASVQALHRNHDFRLLWSGQAVSMLGSRISYVAYPLLVLALTQSPAKAGLVGFATTLPWFLFSLPAGAWLDRLDRKRVMLLCDIGRIAAVTSIPVALWAGVLSFSQILLVAFIEGSLFVLAGVAEPGALRSIVSREQLPEAVARNETREYGAFLIGPPLGGFLFGIGRSLPFVADAVSYVCSLATLLLIKADFQEEREPRGGEVSQAIRDGLVWLWRRPFLRSCSLLIAGHNLAFSALSLTLIVVAMQDSGSSAIVGVVLASIGVGGLMGSLAAPLLQRRLSPRSVVIGQPWLSALLIPLFVVAPTPLVFAPILAAAVASAPVWNATIVGYRIAIVPDELQSRIQSVASLMAMSAVPLGPLMAGFMLERFGGTPTLLVIAGWTLMLAVGASLSRSVRTGPDADQPSSAREQARGWSWE